MSNIISLAEAQNLTLKLKSGFVRMFDENAIEWAIVVCLPVDPADGECFITREMVVSRGHWESLFISGSIKVAVMENRYDRDYINRL